MNDFIKLLLCFTLSFFLCSIGCKKYIHYSKKKEYKQFIRKDIVTTHQKKQGTPTMGGSIIFLSTIASFILFVPQFYKDNQMLSVFFIFLFFALIGLMDDLFKIIYKNSDGLSASIRLLLEIIGSIVAIYIMNKHQIDHLHIPLTHYAIPLGSFLILYYIFVIVGTANAVNFSDGLDGLASGLMISALLPFLLIALKNRNYSLSFFIISFLGSLAGFLRYNFNPAKLFMGDVGSLSMGALYAMIAIVLKNELLILISGFLFFLEIISVILQVGFFKLSHGKRIFKMAPIHHHFERKGFEEPDIVKAFWLFGIICSVLGIIFAVWI